MLEITPESITSRFGPTFLRRSVLRLPGRDRVLEAWMRASQPRHVLETGTFRGASAAYLSQFCDHVHTIDLVPQLREQVRNDNMRRALFTTFGIENVTVHQVTDDNHKAEIIRGLDFDAAFIDGAHDTTGVAADFALVQRCGDVLFHDYQEPNEVWKFVNSIRHGFVTPCGEDFALWIR